MSDRYKNREGPWMQLLSGNRFYPLDFRIEDVDIEDIAYGIGREPRFNGQFKKEIPFYSVAQHCVIGSRLIKPEYAFQFLMHDSTEGVIKDMPKPIKILLPKYNEIEKNVENIIFQKFGLKDMHNPIIKLVDNRMLHTEKRDIMGEEYWNETYPPFDYRITEFWSPEEAPIKFLERFYELTK